MADLGGIASIELILDRSKFDADIRSLQSDKMKPLSVGLTFDTSGLDRQLKAIALKPIRVALEIDGNQLNSQIQSLNLQPLELTLSTVALDRSFKQWRDRALGQSFQVPITFTADLTEVHRQLAALKLSIGAIDGNQSIQLTAQVDDSQLTSLNKHLDLKKSHFAEVNRFFRSSPLTPNVDLSQLDELEQKIGSIKSKQVELKAKVSYDTTAKPPDIAQTVTRKVQVDTDDIEKKLGKSIESAFKSAKRGDLLGGLGNIAATPLKLAASAIGSISSGLALSITQPLGKGLGEGLSTALEKTMSGSVGSSQLLGEKVGGAIGLSIKDGVSSKLSNLGDLLEKQIEKVEDGKLRKDLQEKLAAVREAPQKAKESVTQAIGSGEIQRESLLRDGQRQQQRKAETPIVREQSVGQFRDAAINLEETRSSSVKRLAFIESQIAEKQSQLIGAEQRVKKSQALLSRAQSSGAGNETLQGIAQELTIASRDLASLTGAIESFERGKGLIKGAVKEAEKRAIAANATSQQVAQKTQPKEFVELAKIALGDKFHADKLPELTIADESLKKAGAVSQYDPLRNRIEVTAKFFKELQNATLLSEKQANVLAEELQHAVDFDFGSAKGIQASRENRVVGKPLVPTPKEFNQLAPNLGLYTPERREIELSGKTGAIRSTQEYQQQRGTIQQQSNASAFAATKDIAASKSEGIESKVAGFETLAEKYGVNISKTANAYRGAIEKIQTGFSELAQDALQAANDATLDESKIQQFTQKQQSLFTQLTTVDEKLGEKIAGFNPTREKLNNLAEGAGGAARIAVNTVQQAGSGIQSALQTPQAIALANGLGQATSGVVALGKGGYAVASAMESFVLDLIPAGQTIKGLAKNTLLPAAAFGAATHFLPGGAVAGEALTHLASGALSPLAHTAAGGATDAATQFIATALPKIFGIQGAVTSAVTGAINGSIGGAIAPVAQGLTAVLGGKVLTGVAGRAASSVIAPFEGAQPLALPPSKKPLELPSSSKPLALPQAELVEAKLALPSKPKTLALSGSNDPVSASPSFKEQSASVAFHAGKAAKAVVDAGHNAQDLAQGAIAQAKDLDARFSTAYKSFKDALKSGDNQLVSAYKATLNNIIARGKTEINAVIGDLKEAGDKSGAIGTLGGVKGRLSQKESLIAKASAKFEGGQNLSGLASARANISSQLSQDDNAKATGSDLSAQSLTSGIRQTAKTLDNKRRILLEQLEQSLGTAIDTLTLSLKQQPDLIENSKVTRTLARLNQTAQRVLENQVSVVDGVFEAETAKFTAELNAINAKAQATLKRQPDFGLVADRGISNSVQKESEATVGLNQKDIRKNSRLINEQEKKGLVVNPELLKVQDVAAPSQFGKGAIGTAKSFLKDLDNDLTDAVLKRTQQLVTESKSSLANDLKTSAIVAQGEGDTRQSRKLGKLSGKVEGAIGESEAILAKPRVDVSPQDVARLKALEKEIKGVYAAVDRPSPGGGGFLEKIKEQASGLPGILKQAALGFVGFQLANAAIPALKQFGEESLQAAIKAANLKTALDFSAGSSVGGAKSLEFVRSEVDRLGIPLDSAQKGFSQLSAATKGTSLAGQSTKDIFTGVASAATVLGLSSDDAAGAIEALTKISSKGKVSSEDLREELGTRIPGAFQLAARAVGVTEGELSKMLETGDVISSDFLPKFARELQSSFGGSAESASQNLQSSLFRVNNAFLRLQEISGAAIAPAAAAGLQTLSGALNFTIQNGGKIVTVLATAATAIASAFLPAILSAGVALVRLGGGFAITLIEARLMASGLASTIPGAIGLAAKAFAPLLLQFAAVAIALEVGRALFERFTPSSASKDMQSFADQAVESLKKVEEQGNKTQASLPHGLKSQGVDFAFGQKEGFKSDDFGNFINDKTASLPAPVRKFASNLFTLPFTHADRKTGKLETSAQVDFDRQKDAGTEFSGAVNKEVESSSRGEFFDPVSGKNLNLRSQLEQVAAKDKALAALQTKKNVISAAPRPDQDALRTIDKQILEGTKERETLSAPVAKYQSNLSIQKGNAKAGIATAEGLFNDGKIDKARLGELTKGFEASGKNIDVIQTNVDKVTSSIQTSVTAAKDLNKVFLESAVRLETIAEKNTEAFKKNQIGDVKSRITNFASDQDASIKAPVVDASRSLDKSKAEFTANRTELENLKKEIDAPANVDLLKSIKVGRTGKSIDQNTSVAELEEAKGKLGLPADAEKKDIVERLLEFKKNRIKLTDLESDAQDREIALIKAKENAKLAVIDKAFAQRASAIKRLDANSAIATISKRATNNVSDEDLGIEEAKSQKASVGRETQSANTKLSDLNQAKQQGLIGAEEYEKRVREIQDSLTDLAVKSAQAELAIVQAKNKKIIEGYERTYKIARAFISTDASAASIGAKESQLKGKIVGQGGSTQQNEIEIIAAQRKFDLISRQQTALAALRESGAINQKDFTDRDLALTEEGYATKSQLVDLNTKKILTGIQAETDARKRSADRAILDLNRQKAAQDSLSAKLDVRKGKLEVEIKLNQAINQSAQSALKIQSDRAGENAASFDKLKEKGTGRNAKKVIRDQLDAQGIDSGDLKKGAVTALQQQNAAETISDFKKISALKDQHNLELESVRLGLEKEKVSARIAEIEARRAEISAKIAFNEAQGNLKKAEKTGDKNEIENAKSQVGLAGQNVELAGQGRAIAAGNVNAVDDRALGTLAEKAFSQQKERNELGADIGRRRRARELGIAESADKAKLRDSQYSTTDQSPDYNDQSNPLKTARSQFEQFQQNTGSSEQIPSNGIVGTGGLNRTDGGTGAINTSNNRISDINQGNSIGVSNSMSQLTGSVSDISAKLSAISGILSSSSNRPTNLYVSTPSPVADSAKIMADISKQGVSNAGL